MNPVQQASAYAITGGGLALLLGAVMLTVAVCARQALANARARAARRSDRGASDAIVLWLTVGFAVGFMALVVAAFGFVVTGGAF